jgi:diguanylate cyclase (GGDEF)-like protein
MSATGTPSIPPSRSARSSIPPRRRAPVRVERRGDTFDDQRPTTPRRAPWRVPTEAWLTLAYGLSAGTIAFAHEGGVVGALAASVVAGGLLQRPQGVTACGALGVAAAFVVAGGASPAALVTGAVAALAVAGFAWLPRLVVGGAITAARRSEQERADAELLRLLDDARRLRALGGRPDGDVDATTRDVSCAVTQRDRLYRLLALVERGLEGVAAVALYDLDANGKTLRLVEQRHCTPDVGGPDLDADNHARLELGARGVGPAGVAGLAVQRKTPLRVVDDEGGAVAAHRRAGRRPKSVLCVPLLGARDAVTGVIVVDRLEPVAFSAADEAFVRAAAAEVKDGLAMEALIDDLDAERRRVSRVFGAARTLAGASRRLDVDRLTLAAARDLVAGAAIVDVDADRHFVVAAADGVLAGLAGSRGALEPTSFSARALVEGVPLPHVSLDKATARPLIALDEPVGPAAVGDLRAIPLTVAGDAGGLLLVATRPGERLRSAVVDALVAIADVAALALASARTFDAVERKATTDGLTGVWNRRTLDEKLAEAVARARRSGAPLCVMMTDVDHFKSVNDTWGHATGDEVLKGVAKCLQQGARTTDIVGREEFVVVCEGTDVEGAAIVAERMRLALKKLQFETPKGPLSITSSFGVALLLPDDVDGHATLEAADKNLYKAKQQGRDRVVAG